jgi:hypothetical protein
LDATEAFAHGAGDRSYQTPGDIGFVARNGRLLSPDPAPSEIEDVWRVFVAACKTDFVNIDRIVRIIEFRREQSPRLKAILQWAYGHPRKRKVALLTSPRKALQRTQ